MKQRGIVLLVSVCFALTTAVRAESTYELRRLSEDDWLAMSTEERLRALSMTTAHTPNRTFIGDLGDTYDQYKRWGYDFYEMEDRYENYSFRDFEAYNVLQERRRRWSYNEFGDRIAKMQTDSRAYKNIWTETYSGDKTMTVWPTYRYINGMGDAQLDGVWVAQESTNDWAVSVVSAGLYRKKFTPLTLNLPSMTSSVGIDMQSANTQVSLVTSSMLSQLDWWFDTKRADPTLGRLALTGGVLLRGGSIQRKFGVLTLGANYANAYSLQGNRQNSDSWYGTVNSYMPTPVYVAVRFLDDSPTDGKGGSVIYDMRLEIDGVERPDIIPTVFRDDTRTDRTTAYDVDAYRGYLTPLGEAPNRPPEDDHMKLDIDSGTIPKYGEYETYNDIVHGNNLSFYYGGTLNYNLTQGNSYYQMIDFSGEPVEANGYEAVVFMWDITVVTSSVDRVRAVTRVANDYLIQTSYIFTRKSQGGANVNSGSAPPTWYRAFYWHNAAQAEGNIRDGSNETTVKLDFGYQVAAINYGFNAELNYRGFKVSGEYVTNSNHYMYSDGVPGTGDPSFNVHALPERTGHRWSQQDQSYYIVAQKDWTSVGVSAEVFKMGKFYRPYLDYYTNPYSESGWAMGEIAPRNGMLRIPLIEDNDDGDVYPDTDYMKRTIGFRVWSHEDPDGVFPGNDDDNDGIPDTNKNMNDVPDEYEPFLMYDAIPDAFVFGDDMNNNNIPDFREDDMKYDFPYDLDRIGHHYNLRYTPQENLNLFVGTLRQDGDGRDWRSYNDYFKAQFEYNVQSVGSIHAEYRFERVKDNIADPYLRVDIEQQNYIVPGTASASARFSRIYYDDILEYRNSKVNRIWIDSKIRPLSYITVENLVKIEDNRQIGGWMYDGIYQSDDGIKTYSMINKVTVTKSWGNFSVSPGVNLRFYKKMRDNSIQPQEHNLTTIPLIMFRYDISSQTDIQFGMEGIPGFEMNERDYLQSLNDFKRKTYLLQIENRSIYFGYNIWAGAGFMMDWVQYDEVFRSFENYNSSATFVNVGIGW